MGLFDWANDPAALSAINQGAIQNYQQTPLGLATGAAQAAAAVGNGGVLKTRTQKKKVTVVDPRSKGRRTDDVYIGENAGVLQDEPRAELSDEAPALTAGFYPPEPEAAPQPVEVPPIAAAMQPQEQPGMLSRIGSAIGGGLGALNARPDSGMIYDGMIKGGAAMMMGKNPVQGIAGGLNAFSDTYDAQEKEKRARDIADRPKVTPLADGAFSLVADAKGNTQIVPNKDVQAFLNEQAKQKAEYTASLYGIKQGAQNESAQTKFIRDKATAAAGGIDAPATYSPEVTAKISSIDSAIKGLQGGGPDNVPGLGNSPGIANAWDQTVGRVFNTKDFAARREYDRTIVEEIAKTLKNYGSNPSNRDVEMAGKAVPQQGDSTEAKLAWLKEARQVLHERELRRIEAAQMRDKALGVTGVSNAAPTTATGSGYQPVLKSAKYF